MALVLGMITVNSAQNKVAAVKPNADEQALMTMEKTAWQNLVNKKYDDFEKMFADDYQGIYGSQTMTKATEMAEIRKMTFKSADVSDIKVSMIEKNVAVITASVKADMVMPDGKQGNDMFRTTSIAVKRNGQWKIVYHSHTPMST